MKKKKKPKINQKNVKVGEFLIIGIIWLFLFPEIRDMFYHKASAFDEPIRTLWIIIGSLFDPVIDIILAIIGIISILFFKKSRSSYK